VALPVVGGRGNEGGSDADVGRAPERSWRLIAAIRQQLANWGVVDVMRPKLANSAEFHPRFPT